MPRRRTRSQNSPDIVIITGLSGSGMTSATNAFEDLGYFCVDNMPLTLLPTFARLVQARDEASKEVAKLNSIQKDLFALQQKLGLFLTHLSFFFRFGLGQLRGILRILRLLVAIGPFDFTGQFFLR